MENKSFLTILTFILLNNFVNSQFIKCDINQKNSCHGVNVFNDNLYHEEFICQNWNNEVNTICVPISLVVCNSDYDCQEGFKCIFNQCSIPKNSGIKVKRFNPLDNDYFIFGLCIAIPSIFVGIVAALVNYAKKAYDKAELKRAQNTNASSLSSMNLYSSKNYLNSRSTNNGSSNRSVINFESNQMMDHINYNSNNINSNYNNFSSNYNNFNSNYNNFNSNYNNLNSNFNNNANIVSDINIGSSANGDNDNENNMDFNTQLFMTKNYRMQGYGTNSLPRASLVTSPKLHVPSQFALKDQKNNDSTQHLQTESLEGTTVAFSDLSTKEDIFKNSSAVSSYSNHRSELPPIPTLNKNNMNDDDDDEKSSITYNNQKIKGNSELNYGMKSNKNQEYYNKSYNEIKKNSEQRISVSPPLKDWNDSYITVQTDKNESKKSKAYSSNRENKKNYYKNKDFFGKDSLMRPSPAYKASNKFKHGDYNDYIMALGPNKQQSTDIIDQYMDNSGDSEDITMKNMSPSTISSLTYVPDKIHYSSIKKYNE